MPRANSSLSSPVAPFVVPGPAVDVAAAVDGVSREARRWTACAIGSLVIAGLLSLLVVLGRLPGLSGLIGDPLFFKRCLVVHVDLALVVWFYAFLAALTGLRLPQGTGAVGRAAFVVSVTGVVAMLAGALARGAEPVLANYVPVIDHPLFLAGLAAFFAGVLVYFVQSLAASSVPGGTAVRASGLPHDAAVGLQAAAVAVLLAAAAWVSAQSGLQPGLETRTHFEFSMWGAGHVLQVANACAMLSVWLWLLARATGRPVLTVVAARWLFGLLVAPHFAMPLLTWRGTLDTLYHSGATLLMRWTIFPVVLVVLALGLRHLWRHGRSRDNPAGRVALAGFGASVGLTLLGFILGACIRSSTTLVPAHYHASLGAVTVAFMTAAYLICDAAGSENLPARVWTAARSQLVLFGVGQSVFALGFAIGGAYGLGRKAYASEQHVRSAGELVGLSVMGIGGLVAAAAGIWFLVIVLRSMRGWSWRAHREAPEFSLP